jgi:hypothetical protein
VICFLIGTFPVTWPLWSPLLSRLRSRTSQAAENLFLRKQLAF